MRRIVIATAMSLCVVSLAAVSSADTLVLRDGTRIQGTVVSLAARTVTFKRDDGVSRRYNINQIDAIEFPSIERTAALGTSDRDAVNRGVTSRRASARGLEAPAGTELVVRTVDPIDSRNSKPEQIFSAIFEQAVTNQSGQVIIPEGSNAQLVIREMSSGGTTGSPEMVLDIQSITVNGRKYLVSTTDLTQDSDTGLGKNKRTAEVVGGGAAIGTLIGAIVGGGKGAAIGAVIGAAGGAGAQVMTRGREVRVPGETVLNFRLDRAVMLYPESSR